MEKYFVGSFMATVKRKHDVTMWLRGVWGLDDGDEVDAEDVAECVDSAVYYFVKEALTLYRKEFIEMLKEEKIKGMTYDRGTYARRAQERVNEVIDKLISNLKDNDLTKMSPPKGKSGKGK